MTQEIIQKLCCPFDKADLELATISKSIEGNIEEGYFTCSECNRLYPIIKGIPIMSPDEYRDFSLEKPLLNTWKKHLKGKDFENFRLLGQNS